MKIIAKTRAGLLIEADEYELAKIAGYHGPAHMKVKLEVGAEITVSDLWDVIQHARARRDNIAQTAEKLRIEAGKLDKINQALESPVIRAQE